MLPLRAKVLLENEIDAATDPLHRGKWERSYLRHACGLHQFDSGAILNKAIAMQNKASGQQEDTSFCRTLSISSLR